MFAGIFLLAALTSCDETVACTPSFIQVGSPTCIKLTLSGLSVTADGAKFTNNSKTCEIPARKSFQISFLDAIFTTIFLKPVVSWGVENAKQNSGGLCKILNRELGKVTGPATLQAGLGPCTLDSTAKEVQRYTTAFVMAGNGSTGYGNYKYSIYGYGD